MISPLLWVYAAVNCFAREQMCPFALGQVIINRAFLAHNGSDVNAVAFEMHRLQTNHIGLWRRNDYFLSRAAHAADILTVGNNKKIKLCFVR